MNDLIYTYISNNIFITLAIILFFILAMYLSFLYGKNCTKKNRLINEFNIFFVALLLGMSISYIFGSILYEQKIADLGQIEDISNINNKVDELVLHRKCTKDKDGKWNIEGCSDDIKLISNMFYYLIFNKNIWGIEYKRYCRSLNIDLKHKCIEMITPNDTGMIEKDFLSMVERFEKLKEDFKVDQDMDLDIGLYQSFVGSYQCIHCESSVNFTEIDKLKAIFNKEDSNSFRKKIENDIINTLNSNVDNSKVNLYMGGVRLQNSKFYPIMKMKIIDGKPSSMSIFSIVTYPTSHVSNND